MPHPSLASPDPAAAPGEALAQALERGELPALPPGVGPDAAATLALSLGRPRTALTPSLARNGDRWLSFGTPDGDRQDQ